MSTRIEKLRLERAMEHRALKAECEALRARVAELDDFEARCRWADELSSAMTHEVSRLERALAEAERERDEARRWRVERSFSGGAAVQFSKPSGLMSWAASHREYAEYLWGPEEADRLYPTPKGPEDE